MQKKINFAIFTLFMVVSIVGCSPTAPTTDTQDEPPSIPVEVVIVSKEKTGTGKNYTGSFTPIKDYTILPKFAGKLLTLSVEKGEEVKAGQILATLDTSDVEQQVKQAKAQLDSAKANYNQGLANHKTGITQAELNQQNAERNYNEAKKQADRMKNLKDSGAISTSEWEQAENALRQAESALKLAQEQLATAKGDAGLKAMEATVNQAQVAYETALRNLSDARITSPIDGEVAEINGDVGEMVSPSAPFIRVIDRAEMLFTFTVWEQDLLRLQKGMEVVIQVPSLQKKVNGTIRFIGITPVQNTKTYPVEVSVKNEDKLLSAGLTGEARLTIPGQEYLVVPNDALLEKEGKTYVYIVKGDEALLQEVTVETLDSARSIVKAGLKEGDRVVTKGKYSLSDKAKIKIVAGAGQ
ncbi:efflux RND transporter periplasmic adaptor subunit [Thermicanus aegyptius]|uniref:efflux RND transporter periplasmic adaptor subunit n=1 Tax=Thermicanus aegyptius TaxID=94009 RepID=UPI0004013463|nr:efflux RND transporter periplasmic adaptor subunit [Thermicanus aegyptius]